MNWSAFVLGFFSGASVVSGLAGFIGHIVAKDILLKYLELF